MPELPEIQTTVDQLGRHIPHRRILRTWMDPHKSINTGSNLLWPAMQRHLAGRTIRDVTRRAKYIVIGLDDGSRLWIHQKMTGHLLLGNWRRKAHGLVSTVVGPLRDDPMNRYIRLLIVLDNELHIGLSDARRFARVILTRSDSEMSTVKELSRLGPEPLEMSVSQFAGRFSGKRGSIKSVLMDPTFIVGIGNIYADEILHRSGLHPLARTERLDHKNIADIHRHLRAILTAAIRAGGSSTDDYRAPSGDKGGYQIKHRVYQRTGQRCTMCRSGTIERIFRNGRSSHFCSSHQRCP